nr:protein kinase [uncultured Roseateles sp.]
MKPPALDLSPSDWHVALALLDEVLALDAGQRQAWLAALGPEHASLASALRRLLDDRSALETDDFLSALPSLTGPDGPGAGWQTGQLLGPYELLRELGQGGMASVWLARRADGAHDREVALKLPFADRHPQRLGPRFARERKILSALSHAHIAGVLDAGSDGAQPWLAMEYVDGLPLTEWAKEQQLTPAARLRLFVQVLQAVAHAHAQLIIHRDLKPGNVLVNAQGQVKLLDFGVAKLLGSETEAAADVSDLTREGGRALTPAYASPEQLRGAVLGTASDVYSLGVLLHELLTGQLPYPRLSAVTLEQAILNGEVRRPSQAVQDARLASHLRGDIDTIVMKALALEPTQRYASATAFADDIERHLQALPIAARPQTLGYRLRKLWQRQRLLLVAGSAVALALGLGLSAALWQGQRARQEARRAEAVQQFLVRLLQRTDPQQGQARDLPAGALLDLSVAGLDTEFKDQPDVQAQLLQTLASIYTARGEAAKARPLLERAIAHFAARQPGSEAHVQALVDRTAVLDALDDPPAQRAALAEAFGLAEREFGRAHRWASTLLANQAWLEMSEGALDQAATHAEQARELRRQEGGEQSSAYLDLSGTLATIYMTQGRLQQARELLLRTETLEAALPGPVTIDRAMTGYNLARVDYILGEQAQAQTRLRHWLPQLERIVGPAHARTVMARALLAQSLADSGELDQALAEQRANLATVRAQAELDEYELSTQQTTLARVLLLAGRADEALPLAREALARTEAKYPHPNYRREAMRRVLGEVELALGRRDTGLRTLQAALGHLATLPASGSNALGSVGIRIALAVAQRAEPPALGLIEQACATTRSYQTENGLPLRRCEALQAWIAALQAAPAEREAARQRFTAARDQLFAAGLPERHGLRAELAVAEAEILAPDPLQRARASPLLTVH